MRVNDEVAVPLILVAVYEHGKWNDELSCSEPESGWAVIMLGVHEVARIELPWHRDYQRRNALEEAAATWLAGHPARKG